MDQETFLSSFITPLGRRGEPEKPKASFQQKGSLLDSAGTRSDGEDTIRVFVRIRPYTEDEAARDGVCAGVHALSEDHGGMRKVRVNTATAEGSSASKIFTFNDVFGTSASQDDVYAAVSPCVDNVVDGYNATVLAYG